MLENKKILITGIANKFSIATGIAQSMSKNGAELAFAYQNERLLKKSKAYCRRFRRKNAH